MTYKETTPGLGRGRSYNQSWLPEQGGTKLGSPAPDVNEALSFLERFRPEGPWVLTAIVPDRGTSTTTFRADQGNSLKKWIAAKGGHENIYFQVNWTGARNITRKTRKTDIVRADWLHVDIDPIPGNPKEPLLARIKDFKLTPHVIIDSGGGYQGFWRISPSDDLEDVEAMNRWLAQELGGDHCHNIDRIMRLPATINVPNKKKRSLGRVPTETRLMRFVSGELDTALVGRLRDNAPPRRDRQTVSEWTGPTGKDWLFEVLPPWAYNLLDDPRQHSSRSHHMLAFVGACVRDGVPKELIAWCVTNPRFAVSGHALDQADPMRAVERAIAYVEASDE